MDAEVRAKVDPRLLELDRQWLRSGNRNACSSMEQRWLARMDRLLAAFDASELEVERLIQWEQKGRDLDTRLDDAHAAAQKIAKRDPGTYGKNVWHVVLDDWATAEARLAEVEKDLREDVAALMRAKVQLEENVVLLSEAKEELEREDSDGRALVAALTRAHCCATLEDDGTCGGCPVSAALAPRPMSGQPAEKEPQP